jgi:hypothetical protein
MPYLIMLAVAAMAIVGYLISRRYTHEAVYRRRLRRERVEYNSVMTRKREAEEASRLP